MSRDPRDAGSGRWAPGLAWLLWALTLLGLPAGLWLDHLLRQVGRSDLTIRAHELLFVVAIVGMATVGAVLAGRRPRHPVGWLMLALGLSVAVDAVTDSYARYGLLASPGAVPARFGSRPSPRSGTRSTFPPWRPRPASSPSPWYWSRCSAWWWAAPRWWSLSPCQRRGTPAAALGDVRGGGGGGRYPGRHGWHLHRQRRVVAASVLGSAAVLCLALAAFGTRLRDQVDLDTMTVELLAVAEQTMQPTRASLWLRPLVTLPGRRSTTLADASRGWEALP